MASPTQDKFFRPNRDSVTTINDDGSRNFLHPADVRGFFTTWRTLVGYALIAVFLLSPWVYINGYPALFLDLADRRFHIFGLTLVAQDVRYLFFVLTGIGFTGFCLTAIFGRIWCGWACPHTVFLEHVFRWIERQIEGPSQERKKLDAAPWNSEKILKRGTKMALFFLVSTVIAHYLLAYFVSMPGLYQMMVHAPTDNWGAFVFIFVATVLIFFNFAWFREQLCLIICPYGRLQSALIDDHSLVIGYDEKRGEPRGKAHEEGRGDCIDCLRCVQVCPTGIDIRQGLQIECVSCSNCIDACDEVMAKLKRPKGLVRYDSLVGLSGGKTKFLRPRVYLYAVFLVIGSVAGTLVMSSYRPANLAVTRMQGSPYYLTDQGIRNQYMIRLINKKTEPLTLVLAATAPSGQKMELAGFDEPVIIAPMQEVLKAYVVTVNRKDYSGTFHLTFRAADKDGKFFIEKGAEFLGPDPMLVGAP